MQVITLPITQLFFAFSPARFYKLSHKSATIMDSNPQFPVDRIGLSSICEMAGEEFRFHGFVLLSLESVEGEGLRAETFQNGTHFHECADDTCYSITSDSAV